MHAETALSALLHPFDSTAMVDYGFAHAEVAILPGPSIMELRGSLRSKP